jgi:hypothetical protein
MFVKLGINNMSLNFYSIISNISTATDGKQQFRHLVKDREILYGFLFGLSQVNGA